MILNIDFDGTCVSNEFPNLGKDIGAVPILKRLVENGHQLILYTVRSNKQNVIIDGVEKEGGNYLDEAVKWFEENEIPLFAIWKNPEQENFTDSTKSHADLTIDDKALFSPLIYDEEFSKNPYLDWMEVEIMLEEMELI